MKAGVPQSSDELEPEPVMDVTHCGSAIRYMASLPARRRRAVHEHIKATKMPLEGRG